MAFVVDVILVIVVAAAVVVAVIVIEGAVVVEAAVAAEVAFSGFSCNSTRNSKIAVVATRACYCSSCATVLNVMIMTIIWS